jgi:hypothetical protein
MTKRTKESPMARQAINGHRKNLVLSKDTDLRIRAIKEVSGSPSDAEVIRRAVDFYAQVIKFQATGYIIAVQAPDGKSGTPLQHVFKRSALFDAGDETLTALEIPRSLLAQASAPVFELA